jgi:hypothetical protein
MLGSPFVMTYTVADPAPSTAIDVRVAAREGSRRLSAQATVRIVRSTTPPGDRLLTNHTRGATPDVALVTGKWGGVDVADSVFAIVGIADLGGVGATNAAAGDAVISFSATDSMRYRLVPWTVGPKPDTVDLRPTKPPFGATVVAELRDTPARGALRAVPVALWLAFEPPSEPVERARVLDELDLADSIFRMNRAGIRFDANGPVVLPNQVSDGCDGAWEILRGGRPVGYTGAWPDLAADVVHVVYCAGCIEGSYGVACSEHPDSAALILVESGTAMPSTLAHELAHTLGLRGDLEGGHVTDAIGFGHRNLMATFFGGQSSSFRDHLSLGQVFRMNVDRRSFLCRHGNCPSVPGLIGGVHCQDDPLLSTPCLCLAADPLPPFNPNAWEVCK